jgi:hypothetical protein
MMTNAMFVVIFYSSYATEAHDNNEHTLSLSSTFFSNIVKDMKSILTPPKSLVRPT